MVSSFLVESREAIEGDLAAPLMLSAFTLDHALPLKRGEHSPAYTWIHQGILGDRLDVREGEGLHLILVRIGEHEGDELLGAREPFPVRAHDERLNIGGGFPAHRGLPVLRAERVTW